MARPFLIILSIIFFGTAFQSEAQTLVWTSNGASKIQQLSGGTVSDLISSGVITPWGITVDLSGNKLYWTNVTEGTIKSADLDGSNIQTIFSGLDLPRGIAIDPNSKILYWVEAGNSNPGLRSTDLNEDPLSKTDIVTTGIVSPYHIALDTENQFVYWVDNATGKKLIQRVQYDGSGTETIISSVNQVAGITLDATNNTLYWSDFEDDVIYSATANASDQNIQTVSAISGDATPWSISLDNFSENLFWTDYLNSAIYQINLSTSAQTELASTVSTPSGIASYTIQTITPGDPGNFITTWKTDNDGTSNDDQITIPTEGSGYVYDVYWEDVTNSAVNGTLVGQTGDVTIDFPAVGTYRVEISGDFPRIYINFEGDKDKILTIEQWGGIHWTSMNAAFYGASNMTYNATDAPDLSGVTNMENMFALATSFNGDLNGWYVSSVENMSGMFFNASSFNGDLSGWDVSSVQKMSGMFHDATSFNGDLSDWNVSSVTSMRVMFDGATSFNGDLSDWNVSSVTDMSSMFRRNSFNGDLSKWNVSKVESMFGMFELNPSFNRDISGWDVSSVTTMEGTFRGAISFNGDLSLWDVSSVEIMLGMFNTATSFNGDLSDWNVSSVTNMRVMFDGATSFNGDLSDWDVSGVTDMERMLNASGLSAANYDATLIGWSGLILQNNITLGADGLNYCSAQSERQSIIDTYGWTINGDTFNCPPPVGSDQRILAANGTPYMFSGPDFGITEAGYSVKIESLPGNGSLLADGIPVSVDDVLPVEDINDGDLRWDSQTSQHGYDYTSFGFREVAADNTPADEANTMTIDLGASMMTLTGNQGWRLMGNPSGGDTYADFLDPVWTKGIAGSDDPLADKPSIYRLDQDEYDWEQLGDMSNPFDRGRASLVYIYADDNNSWPAEGFPKMLSSGRNWQPLSDGYTYSGLFYDPDQPEGSNSHFLLANPHPVSLDFCEFVRDKVAKSVDFWDPQAGGGNGDYVNQSCAEGDVFIAPFQGFWIRTTDDNPALEIPIEAYLGSAEDGYLKNQSKEQNLHLVQLRVTSDDQEFTNKVNLLFSKQAAVGLDDWDAPKLSAKSLAPQYLSFYSLGEQGTPYAMQSLPADMNQQIRIPLGIETTQTGNYSLEWSLPPAHIFGGSYFLRDNHTDEVIELRQGTSYRFSIDAEQADKAPDPTDIPLLSNPQQSSLNVVTTTRFELLVAGAGVDGMSELGAIPEEFVLSQNYPNPFNPTTVISYQLPVTSQVRLEVYDMTGRSVATLVSGQVAAGRHAVNFDASGLSSGVYLYRLQAGGTIMTRKLTVLK